VVGVGVVVVVAVVVVVLLVIGPGAIPKGRMGFNPVSTSTMLLRFRKEASTRARNASLATLVTSLATLV
jgi:hypothetical protein